MPVRDQVVFIVDDDAAVRDSLKLLLEIHMTSLWAEEMLREHGGSLSADALKKLVLLATGDAWQAEDAWVRRAMEEQRAGNFTADGV